MDVEELINRNADRIIWVDFLNRIDQYHIDDSILFLFKDQIDFNLKKKFSDYIENSPSLREEDVDKIIILKIINLIDENLYHAKPSSYEARKREFLFLTVMTVFHHLNDGLFDIVSNDLQFYVFDISADASYYYDNFLLSFKKNFYFLNKHDFCDIVVKNYVKKLERRFAK